MKDIEDSIKKLVKDYKINIIYENHIEIFETTHEITINKVINEINNIFNTINNPSIDDIKNNILTDKISLLEANIDYLNKCKLLKLKNISILEKTKQIEIEKCIRLEDNRTKIKLEEEKSKIRLEEEKTKQIEILSKQKIEEEKTKQLELQIMLIKIENNK